MKDKIYVRNTFGNIYKVDDLTDVMYKTDVLYNRIVKHSTDIKDLIVVGDIVKYRTKGVRIIKLAVVREFLDARSNKERLIVGGYSPEQIDILEILTKEQYIANCYKV